MSRPSWQTVCGRASKDYTGSCGINGVLILCAAICSCSRTQGAPDCMRDGSGLWVCAKRLEKGRFHWPEAMGEGRIAMSHEESALLLNGIDLEQARRQEWYRKVPA